MWSFPAQASSPTSCLSSLEGESLAREGKHKGGVVPSAAVCHWALIDRC